MATGQVQLQQQVQRQVRVRQPVWQQLHLPAAAAQWWQPLQMRLRTQTALAPVLATQPLRAQQALPPLVTALAQQASTQAQARAREQEQQVLQQARRL